MNPKAALYIKSGSMGLFISHLLSSVAGDCLVDFDSGTFNKSQIDEQIDLENVTFTMFGDLKCLHEGSVRMLNHLTLVPMIMGNSNIESIAKVNVQPFASSNLHPAIKGVIDRIPAAMMSVYEWVKDNVVSQETDEIFQLWSMECICMPFSSMVLLPIWNMETYDLCLRFIWHETMRVYLDRLTNLDKVQKFRTSVCEVLTTSLGAQYRRSIRLASESHTFHVLLPHSQNPLSAVDWDMHELDAESLTIRAIKCIEQRQDIDGSITCI